MELYEEMDGLKFIILEYDKKLQAPDWDLTLEEVEELMQKHAILEADIRFLGDRIKEVVQLLHSDVSGLGQPSLVWVGVLKISPKNIKFCYFFPSGKNKSPRFGSKSTRIKDGSAFYLLQVKSMLESGQGPSLQFTLYSFPLECSYSKWVTHSC